jgi:hypothetical protein
MLTQFTDRQKFYLKIFPQEKVYFYLYFVLIVPHILNSKLISVLYVVAFVLISGKTFLFNIFGEMKFEAHEIVNMNKL